MIFLDRMARARDELWEQYRKTMTPSVHDLKAPWPRGHPFQSLVPFKVKGPCNIPYVESRVRNLVFADPHVFLTPWSNDKDEKEAIGPYIDNWKTALEFYVEAGPVADRRNRIRLAWDHATGPLSESRMSLTEAYRFWPPTFALLDVKTKDLPTSYRQCPQRDLSCPRMPRPDDPSDPIEWNPESVFASHPERIEERELSLTYLDIMLDDMKDEAPCGEEFRRKSSIPAVEYSLDLWQFQKWKRRLLPADTIDVVLGAALLCVNSCLGGRSSLLIAPFPSSMEARFPALYLEEEFLERASKTSHWAYAALHKFKRDIPITLLKRLASSMFQEGKVNIDAQARHHRRDFVILKLLSESDDPSVVCSFIQDTLKTPEGSSWHRLLLSAGLLRSLPPCTVQDVLLEFATTLFGTDEPDPGVQTASNPEARRPHVKVTTVKMLAQLLQDAPYASPGFSVELLGRILRGSKHIDVHAAALASLVDIGLATECDNVGDSVIEKLRQYAVPRASSVHEFRALREEQWQEAERSGAVPEIWDSMEDPPVVSLLTKAAKAFKTQHDSGGNGFMDVFMEAMQASGNVHLRWMEVFMAKHGYALGEDERLPAVPFRVKALNDAMPKFQASPEAFDTMKRHVLLNTKPGPGFQHHGLNQTGPKIVIHYCWKALAFPVG